ncbi:MAG TPA: threonine ammonia-lyase [Methanoculleus sp.]|nr:threonine ammonia-lyase [Methanoculleus sp.]
MVSLADIRHAQERIRDHVLATPLVYSPTFSAMTGARVFLKLENLQKAGSFKVRGAMNTILSRRASIGSRGVIAASAGNHAQGVAVAAQLAGVAATIVMPESVSISKEEATRGYGAEVLLRGSSLDESLAHAHERAAEGYTFIHPYDDPAVIAGQGTIALEIFEKLARPDLIVVPVGGGGLISGIATAAKALHPPVRVVGVQAAACPSAVAARRTGGPVRVAAANSIADGILVPTIGELPYALMERNVDEVVSVSEDRIAMAMVLLLERKRVLAEGAGAVPLAALLDSGIEVAPGSTVVLVISGGNVDTPLLGRIIRKGMLKNGRIVGISVVVDDTPGTLAQLLEVIARMRGNILHIRHERFLRDLPVQVIRVDLEFETRGHAHIGEIIGALRDHGYAVEVQ